MKYFLVQVPGTILSQQDGFDTYGVFCKIGRSFFFLSADSDLDRYGLQTSTSIICTRMNVQILSCFTVEFLLSYLV